MARGSKVTSRGKGSEIEAFLAKVAAMPARARAPGRGRLMFALDATMSRQPTWDRACEIQAAMFEETAALGGLEIQVAYFRGHGEFRATAWLADPEPLRRAMTGVACRGGFTQIAKVLRHGIRETASRSVQALVYVGDCAEEDFDELCGIAGELGVLGVPVFIFHEGRDAYAGSLFREIARLTGGAYCPFDATSARQLRDLLKAVAVYAAGGLKALEDLGKKRGGEALRLIGQLK